MNLEDIINLLPENEQEPLRPLLAAIAEAELREEGQKDFMSFVNTMWPGLW